MDVWCKTFCCMHSNFKTVFQSAPEHEFPFKKNWKIFPHGASALARAFGAQPWPTLSKILNTPLHKTQLRPYALDVTLWIIHTAVGWSAFRTVMSLKSEASFYWILISNVGGPTLRWLFTCTGTPLTMLLAYNILHCFWRFRDLLRIMRLPQVLNSEDSRWEV